MTKTEIADAGNTAKDSGHGGGHHHCGHAHDEHHSDGTASVRDPSAE
jgi:hypothetical protein